MLDQVKKKKRRVHFFTSLALKEELKDGRKKTIISPSQLRIPHLDQSKDMEVIAWAWTLCLGWSIKNWLYEIGACESRWGSQGDTPPPSKSKVLDSQKEGSLFGHLRFVSQAHLREVLLPLCIPRKSFHLHHHLSTASCPRSLLRTSSEPLPMIFKVNFNHLEVAHNQPGFNLWHPIWSLNANRNDSWVQNQE